MIHVRPIMQAIVDGHRLPLSGIHGLRHWARVYENGLRVAEATGGDPELVLLFALFHDSRRENDHHDPEHGLRGGQLAKSLHGELFDIGSDRLATLDYACRHHTDGMTHADPTIQPCWDADRLDLARVGIQPDPKRLCTPAGGERKTSGSSVRFGGRKVSFASEGGLVRGCSVIGHSPLVAAEEGLLVVSGALLSPS